MTFPSVAARNQGAASANVTTTALPLPASIAVNNLLCAWVALDGTVLPTWGTGFAGWNVLFTGLDGGTTSVVGAFLYKIATGTESGNLGITTPSEAWAGHTWRITGYDPNTAPAFATAGDAGTGSTNPDPPSLDPADWATEDVLWLALGAGDGNVAFTAAPTNYTTNANFQLSTNVTTTDRVASGQGDRALNAASENPGTFTRATEDWLAATVGIRGSQTATVQSILRNATFYSASGTTPTNAFTLDAGTNRRIMVSVAHETAGVTVSSMTYGGVSMALVTDGTDSAASTNTGRVEWWTLRESSLPSNGSQNLVVTLSATAECTITIMVVNNTDQGTNVRDVVNANTAGATTLTSNMNVVHAQDMILSCTNGNNNVAFTNYTVNSIRAMGRGSCNLPTGGAFVMNVARIPGTTGTLAVVSTLAASTRQVASSVVLAPFTVQVSGAVTSGAPTTSGAIEAESAGGPDPSFVTSDVGNVPRSVVVDASTNLLVCVSTNSAAHTTARTATYNGVTMDAATTSNDFVQIHYMLNPPSGSHTLDVTPVSNLSEVITLQFADIDSFESAQEAAVASASFNPSRRAAIVFGMSAVSTAHTPVSGTVEVHDAGGDYAAYRLTTAGGSVTVGVASATDPDSAGAIFIGTNPAGGVDITGAVSSSSPTTSGNIDTPKNVSGSVTSSSPQTTGNVDTPKNISGAVSSAAPATSGSLQVVVNITGTVTSSAPSTSGSLDTPKNLSGAVTSSSPATAGSIETPKSISGAVSSTSPTTSGSIQVVANVTGSVTSSSPQTAGSFETPHNLSGAVASSSPQTAGSISVTAEVSISGDVASSSPTTAGTLQVVANLAGDVASSSPTTAGALAVIATIAGAVATAAAVTAGSLSTPKNVSGDVISGAPTSAGSLQLPKNISGTVVSGAPTTDGTLVAENAGINISGAVASAPPTTLGSLQVVANITGTVVSSAPTSSGALEVVTRISGDVATTSPTTEGFIHRTIFISGDVVTSAPVTAGSILLGEQPRGETQAQVGFDFSVAVVNVDLRSGVLVHDDPGVVVVLHLDVSKVEIGEQDDG